MSLEENKDLVRRLFAEVFGAGNAEAVGEFFVPKSLLFGSMQKLVTNMATSMPGHKVEIEELLAEGDKVTACVTASGTNSGPILGHPPTNQELSIFSIWVFTVRNGRVISLRTASDLAQQLWLAGLTPEAASG